MSEEDYSRYMPGNNDLPSDSDRLEQPDLTEGAEGTSEMTSDVQEFKETEEESQRREEETESEDIQPKEETGKSNAWLYIGLPLIGVICLVIGLVLGSKLSIGLFKSEEEKQKELVNQKLIEKLGPALYTVRNEYVDELSLDTLIDKALSGLMNSLDPHSVYIPASQLSKVNEELEGEFSGVGVSFIVYNDSIAVIDVIEGGPAERVGLQRGDRIVSANGINLTGKEITSDSVFKTLRGKQGTNVAMKIVRPGQSGVKDINVTRGAVPVKSVDAAYIMEDGKTGYLKISSFTVNTYAETLYALSRLKRAGAEEFVIDLRGNPGGFMDQAILIANEFLPAGRGIVYTKARRKENETNVKADGTGAFQNNKIAILIDESSASASEILAGAIQDNDRGVVVGRRSFGKGLVQNQFNDVGGGALRLTVARYFTPSGRSIQKEYTLGNHEAYAEDLLDRYNNGELFNADSIKFDKSKTYKTVGGRTVYGGGGIMPDIFVPEDTISYTPYYIKAMNSGLLMNFAFKIADTYRPLLKNVTTEQQLFRIIPTDSKLLSAFVEYAEKNGLPAAWYYINQSADMIVNKIKAFVARDILSDDLFYKMFNKDDSTLKKATEALKDNRLPNEPRTR